MANPKVAALMMRRTSSGTNRKPMVPSMQRNAKRHHIFPTKRHQLVDAHAWQRRAHPPWRRTPTDKLSEKRDELRDAQQHRTVLEDWQRRNLPAAKEERGSNRADDIEIAPLGKEEEQKAHAAVFGHVAGDQLRFCLRNIERRPISLGERGREIEKKTPLNVNGLWNRNQSMAPALGFDDSLHAHCAGQEDNRE